MTNKLKKYSKIEKSIYVFSFLQLLSYGYTLLIIYSTNHDDNPSDFDGMGALFPAFMFVILGVINLVLFVTYLVRTYKGNNKPKRIIVSIILILVFLTLVSGNFIDFVNSL